MQFALWATSVMLLAGPAPAAGAEPLYGTRERPLTGDRYQTLRGLAQYLDQTAQGALEGAVDDVRHGKPGGGEEARFLSSIRSFARDAAGFRRRVDAYPQRPFEVPPQAAALADSARDVSGRIRAAHALESTHDEWDAMSDVLERVTGLLEGAQVSVPAPYLVPALSGAPLERFRQLAHDLDVATTRAHSTAKRHATRYDRGPQFLGELGYFAAQSRDLHLRADAGPVGPQLVGPIVDHLLDEARLADRRMREAKTLEEVWDDSGRAITILEQMAMLVRS
ncbi:MAG TPA: hypothetical protein VMR21_13385 [Vicinamibacteria bacterium]|nr:hypothetical protein [Vicinamibacteria bacterium]